MKWFTKLASTPPPYTAERISDLSYARKLCLTEPSEAIVVLRRVSTRLEKYLNHYLADKVAQIIPVLRDNPNHAREMIDSVIVEMRRLKDER